MSNRQGQLHLESVTTLVRETSKIEASPQLNVESDLDAEPEVVKSVAPNLPIESSSEVAVTATRELAGDVVEIRADQILARVNGLALTLKDLLPIGAADAALSLTQQRYDFLLERAIVRELTFQAAQAQGISLSQEQTLQLQQVRESMLAHYGAASPKVVHLNVTGTLEDRIAFELRDAASPLLLHSLLTKAGGPSPYVTETQVAEYYRSHSAEYDVLPGGAAERQAAWERINLAIRNKLIPETQAQYQRALSKMLEQLRASANITLIATSN